MGLLTRKYRPVAMPLSMPALDRVALPDLNLLRKYRDRIEMTNDEAMREGQDPVVRSFSQELGEGLYEAFMAKMPDAMSEDEAERFIGATGVAVCIGVGYSIVDDNLGIPKGLTEQCTLAAVSTGVTSLDSFPAAWRQPVFFSMQAGHYMGRMGRSSIPSLLAQAAK